jgi:cytidylate kinase
LTLALARPDMQEPTGPDDRMDHNLLVTVSGPPGSGASTLSRRVAEELGAQRLDGGDLFRKLAEERDMSLTQLQAKADEDPEIDRRIDERLQRTAEVWGASNKGFVLESRLAGWLAGNRADLRVWVDAPEEVRVERTRDRREMAAEMRVREVTEAGRFESEYGVDVTDTSSYDLSLNTARWSVEDCVGIVLSAVRAYDPENDEGAFERGIDLDGG